MPRAHRQGWRPRPALSRSGPCVGAGCERGKDRPMAELRLAVAGLGAIGLGIARRVAEGAIPGLRLAAVAARDRERARRTMAALGAPLPVLPLAALAEAAEVVVECLPAKHFLEVAMPAIAAGRIFMPLSVGALIEHMAL